MTAQELAAKDKQELKEPNQTRPVRTFIPDVDIAEDDAALHLWAEMPGVDQSRVTVELEEDQLTLEGEVDAAEYEGLTPQYTEYNVGRFARRFTLADAGRFDRDAITARMSNGVLEIVLPKGEKAKPRRIQVTS